MQQSFELIDLVLFLGISQGIFLAVIIQIIQNRNKEANNILSFILLLSVLMLLGRMIFFKFLTLRLLQWSIIIDAVIFIFGPLCYIYFRRLVFSEKDVFKLTWMHYVPVILHVLFSCYTLSLNTEEFSNELSSGFFRIPFGIIEGSGILSNFYYWVLNIRLLKSYKKEEKNQVSYKQNLASFLKFFQVSIGVFLLFWAVSFIALNFFDYSIEFITYNSVWGAISLFIFVVGYYSLKEPELFRIPFRREKVKTSQRLPQNQISALEKELNYFMNEERIFLKSNLTLGDLAKRLNTSPHNVSWYLNTIVKNNFYDYINHYRIKEFLRRIKNDEHMRHTILAIAMEVGFNSKSTFNKAFKLEMNTTPSTYIKGLKVA